MPSESSASPLRRQRSAALLACESASAQCSHRQRSKCSWNVSDVGSSHGALSGTRSAQSSESDSSTERLTNCSGREADAEESPPVEVMRR